MAATTAKSLAEQIKNLEAELKQKENKLKELKQKHTSQEDKERVHRLIERGKLLEKFIEDATTYTDGQIELFLEKTITTDFARKILTQFKENTTDEITVNQKTPKHKSAEVTGEKPEIVEEPGNEG
jgi:protein subunit release factor B